MGYARAVLIQVAFLVLPMQESRKGRGSKWSLYHY